MEEPECGSGGKKLKKHPTIYGQGANLPPVSFFSDCVGSRKAGFDIETDI